MNKLCMRGIAALLGLILLGLSGCASSTPAADGRAPRGMAPPDAPPAVPSAGNELKGTLFYNDGKPGRVSFVDLAIQGRPGQIMYRAIPQPPYRDPKPVTVNQEMIDDALQRVSLDGVITRDEEGNVIIVISATHRRIITPQGKITEVFEKPEEFTAFFFNYTSKYPRVVKAIDASGGYKAYLTVPLKEKTLNRVYMRVTPYEEVCVIEALNYPVTGYAYHEVRATGNFMQQYPNATYLENTEEADRFQPLVHAKVHPVENGYFSFIQGVSSSNFNNKINVYEEQVRELSSRQNVADISAQEMEKLFDGSLLNAEIIVGKGNAISTQTYEKMR